MEVGVAPGALKAAKAVVHAAPGKHLSKSNSNCLDIGNSSGHPGIDKICRLWGHLHDSAWLRPGLFSMLWGNSSFHIIYAEPSTFDRS